MVVVIPSPVFIKHEVPGHSALAIDRRLLEEEGTPVFSFPISIAFIKASLRPPGESTLQHERANTSTSIHAKWLCPLFSQREVGEGCTWEELGQGSCVSVC